MARRKKRDVAAGSALNESTRQRVLRRFDELKRVRSSWERAWKTIVEQIQPYRARWGTSQFNDGTPLTTNIINSTPSDALRVFESGILSGMTSPAKPWIHLLAEDDELNDLEAVKKWLQLVQKVLLETLDKRGYYTAASGGGYRDVGMIGNSVILEEEDKEDMLPTFEAVPIGEYYLDVDEKNRVDTFFRERTFTVRQLVERFGYDNCSTVVQENWNNGNIAKTVETVHAIWPNIDYTDKAVGAKGMKWSSHWVETKGEDDKLLEESGYREFPALCPRIGARTGEAYGRGPGWFAVGDCLALQHLMKKLARMVDKTADPPMVGVDTIKTKRASLVPGDVTYVPPGVANAFTPAQTIHPNSIAVVREYIQDHENRIRDCFFYKLWMNLLNDPRAQRPTATEVEYTKQEVMLQLGPVLQAFNWELLAPLVDRTFNILLRAGKIPPPPPEMEGTSIKVQFISVMHMAQHMVGISAIRELEQHVAGMAQLGSEEALLKLNVPRLLNEVGDMAGVPRDIMRTDEEVEEIQAERAAQMKAQQEGEAMLAATEGIRNVANADPQKLTELQEAMAGSVAAAQGG